jgi:anhydro-N-acetylmuramic acid kinase
LRDALLLKPQPPPFRAVGDALATAVRKVTSAVGTDSRELFCIGLMAPGGGAFATTAETVADQTGITVLSSFSARDLAAGGMGGPLTPAADYLLCSDEVEDRLLLHLGSNTSLVFLPANAKTIDIVAFDAGPGNRFLDAIVRRCTREKEHCDVGGHRAVQGRLSEELLDTWSKSPYFLRKPPKTLSRSDFDDAFTASAIEDAQRMGLGLNDLLCTATHFVARGLGFAARQWLPTSPRLRNIYLSGGGTRNGFLRQLLAQRFPGEALHPSDDLGVPGLTRKATAAAILAALAVDGITGNLPQLTGATGGRLCGRIVPGDPRNWALVAAWAAEQMWDYVQFAKAA